MKRFTKALSMLLAIVMVVGLLPLSIIAEDIQTTHTVQFKLNYNGAHKIPSQKVADGECAVQPDDVTREGWIFEYWYVKTGDGIQKFDLSQPITEDVTLYARWDEDITYWGPIWGRNILSGIAESEKEDKPEKPDKEEPDDEGTAVTYTLTFHWNLNSGDVVVQTTVAHGDIAEEPEYVSNDNYQLIGWYDTINPTDLNSYYDFSLPVESNMELYARWVDMTDTDSDGIVDGGEEIFGTDKDKADTDNDGLTDYEEIYIFGYDPLVADTDGNGVSDANEDGDADGLTNIDEINGDTDPAKEDTDYDGLLDGEEINLGTNPIDEDTDDDGVSDGREVELGTDPLIAQKEFTIAISADDLNDSVTPSVSITLSGEQVESLSISPMENQTFFPENMPGYLGKAYDFSVEGSFEKAIISFEFDPSILESGVEPVIYYFNEETQELEPLETSINGNVASAEVTHFSKYILINRIIYEESFEWQDMWDSDKTYTSAEVVLVIDDSGSLGGDYGYNSSTGYFSGGTDPMHQRLNVARDFVDGANSTLKIGIVKFDGVVDNMSNGLVVCDNTGKNTLKNILKITYDDSASYNKNGVFDSRGYTYMYTGIDQAFDLFSENSESVLQVVIVFTDGQAHDTEYHNSVVQKAVNNNVKIYAVGLGLSSSYFDNYLRPLAQQTGGILYQAENADELSAIYNDISEKIDITTDTDEDKIPDYYEDNMVIFNGVKIKLDKNDPDTDGDGLLDGEEIQLTYTYNADKTKVIVKGKMVLGNPAKYDTDEDGYSDRIDGDWSREYVVPVILLHGRGDNTKNCYGASTLISPSVNSHYGKSGTDYTDPANHKITSVSGGLASVLVKNGYEANYSLFAFNYPNQDMCWLNAQKLSDYINNLVLLAKSGTREDVAEKAGIFPTKACDTFKFDLVGHSNGGLVSRYYIENLEGEYNIRKLITIDTPHYGSGIAYGSEIIDIADLLTDCYPMDVDLNPSSTLYNGGRKKTFVSLADPDRASYINNNQSPKLNGNAGVYTDYYALGAYDVDGQGDGGLFKDEMDQIPTSLRNTQFIFDFDRALYKMDDFLGSIRTGYRKVNSGIVLDLKDSSGDNVVNVRSQYGVKDSWGYIVEAVYFTKTSMTVDTVPGHTMVKHFHGQTQKNTLTMNKVVEYLED